MAHIRLPIFAIPLLAIALSVAGLSAAKAQSSGAQQQQQTPGAQQQQQTPQSSQNFSEEDLKSYAVAALQVQQINQNYQPQLQAAGSPEKKQAVQQEAMGKMVQAVQQEGLSVDKYNEISAAIQSDPQVADQVRGYMSAPQ